MKRWTRIKYQPNLPLEEGKYVTCSNEHRALAREAAKEGIVLLKNEKEMLPLKKGTRLAIFGRGIADYVKGGGGSGAVLVKKDTTLYDVLAKYPEHVSMYAPLCDFYYQEIQNQYASGLVPGMTYEPEIPEELLEGAKEFADTAMIVLSRFSGEGWDRSDIEFFDGIGPDGDEKTMPRLAGKYYPNGDFYITKEEKQMIAKVKENFENVIVVLNIGGVIDTLWCKEDEQICAVLNMWQGGMEGAQAAAEILLGLANPCGKLVDTFAKDINSYPSETGYHESVEYVNYIEDVYVGYRYFETIPGAKEEVCFPFGYGLQTAFVMELKENIVMEQLSEKLKPSVLKERMLSDGSFEALREIYLKGFEMTVKEAKPWAIMSSYNIINGHRASECWEFLEDILRGEWGYEGVVMTDWWTRGEHYKEILAGNDLKMACGFPDRVKQAQELGIIERGDLIRSAKRVLGLILKME